MILMKNLILILIFIVTMIQWRGQKRWVSY